MTETDEIISRYKRRSEQNAGLKYSSFPDYTRFLTRERNSKYTEILKKNFTDFASLKMLEIGAGNGNNLELFHQFGIPFSNIYANELLENRLTELNKKFPLVNILPGDALQLTIENKFDVVFQSTVFTSILEMDFKKRLAGKMFDLLKPGGIILWYDFVYNNPKNPDVKGVPKSEIRKFFPQATEINFYPVTLAPPIGRRVGNLYPLFNFFRFLRTHVIAVIRN